MPSSRAGRILSRRGLFQREGTALLSHSSFIIAGMAKQASQGPSGLPWFFAQSLPFA